MAVKRIRVIPDRLFHKLWDLALNFSSVDEFISDVTSELSKEKVDFNKYDIDYVLACDILVCIFEAATSDFSRLLKENSISKAAFSHRFCIPIKTVESWCSGRSKVPSYVRIMVMEEYNIPYLPKFVYTQSLDEKRYKNITKKDKNNYENGLNKTHYSSIIEEDDFDFDEIDSYLESLDKKLENNRFYDDNLDFLKKTDYLGDIIRRKK